LGTSQTGASLPDWRALFLMGARAALQEAGWTPQWTLTEDFALGLEMKKHGWHCRYLREYLATGEAPDGVRNCYQQRSRWTKVGARAPGAPCPAALRTICLLCRRLTCCAAAQQGGL
jgi:Glycosyl transferase family group 2